MQLLLLFTMVALIVTVVSAEPRLRFSNSAESGLLRRAGLFFRKRGSAWDGVSAPFTFTNLAEKRRVRELFGKRSAPAVETPDVNVLELPDDQYPSLYDSMLELHRDRRGRVRELFG
ncbi:hypothetical protein RB195_002314 [Necator americanus]|nr:hypothetical protein NECAME_08261 [Necator americanus]ETN82001.1 hypothetical protein NECAME_08261 [Necator americanus]